MSLISLLKDWKNWRIRVSSLFHLCVVCHLGKDNKCKTMQDHHHLVVRIATAGDGTECECVLSGQTGDWRMLAGGIWRMFATDCHLLIVSSHSFPHLLLLLLLHSSIVICTVILSNTFLPVTVHSYTGGPRKKAVSLFSTQPQHSTSSVQQFGHWYT